MVISWSLQIILYVVLLLFLLGVGQWIAFALGTVGLIGIALSGAPHAFDALGFILWNNINCFELTAVPLFVFMGDFVMRSGFSDKFYSGASKWVSKLPGKLLQTNITACAFFAAISGSSVATAASMGTVAIPELTKRNYETKAILGSIAGGGSLGVLIPPSIPFIVYGALVEESIAKLFIAGVIPGVMLVVFFMIYLGLKCTLQKDIVPDYSEIYTSKEKLIGIIQMVPIIVLIVIILGGIYFGWTTPTEAAALGGIVAIIMSILSRTIKWNILWHSLNDSVRTTCMVLFIIVGAQIMSNMIVVTGINRSLTAWVIDLHLSWFGFLFVLIVIYIILGCLMDGISMMYLTLPVLYPLIKGMGYDPIWFGVILVILIELAQITPPMGLNLFVIQGISKKDVDLVIRGSFPYFIIMLFGILLVAMFPCLAIWLPSKM